MTRREGGPRPERGATPPGMVAEAELPKQGALPRLLLGRDGTHLRSALGEHRKPKAVAAREAAAMAFRSKGK